MPEIDHAEHKCPDCAGECDCDCVDICDCTHDCEFTIASEIDHSADWPHMAEAFAKLSAKYAALETAAWYVSHSNGCRDSLRELAELLEGSALAALLDAPAAPLQPTFPCAKCGALRTEAEGGKVFTVCDKCWPVEAPQPSAVEVAAQEWADAMKSKQSGLSIKIIESLVAAENNLLAAVEAAK